MKSKSCISLLTSPLKQNEIHQSPFKCRSLNDIKRRNFPSLRPWNTSLAIFSTLFILTSSRAVARTNESSGIAWLVGVGRNYWKGATGRLRATSLTAMHGPGKGCIGIPSRSLPRRRKWRGKKGGEVMRLFELIRRGYDCIMSNRRGYDYIISTRRGFNLIIFTTRRHDYIILTSRGFNFILFTRKGHDYIILTNRGHDNILKEPKEGMVIKCQPEEGITISN